MPMTHIRPVAGRARVLRVIVLLRHGSNPIL